MAEAEDNIRRVIAERDAKKTPITDQLLADLTTMKRLLYPLIEQTQSIDITAKQVQHVLNFSINTAGSLNVSAVHIQQDLREFVLPKVKRLVGITQEVEELYNSLSGYQTELNARGKK